MKKKAIVLLIALSVFLVACVNSDMDGEAKSTSNTAKANNQTFKRYTQQNIKEEKIRLKLPKSYAKYTQLVGMDEKFYYLASGSDPNYWTHIAVEKNSHRIKELANCC